MKTGQEVAGFVALSEEEFPTAMERGIEGLFVVMKFPHMAVYISADT